ncbi:hypothetical protein HYDPIDRAFT_104722 [Hydnomerulius pinastri MD-312]|nr:hypothetical protein HYDPIDRAFT_104722 [Hydnomerulius pinastri MD-312]
MTSSTKKQPTDAAIDIAEIPYAPRPRARSFYVVLFFVVIPLWSVIPLAWTFVIYTLYYGKLWNFGWKGISCFALALSEVFFSVHHYHLVRSISGPSPNGPGNLAEMQAGMDRVLKSGLANLSQTTFDEESLDHERPGSPAESVDQLQADDPRAVEFRECMRAWFRRATWSSIKKQGVHAYLYWVFFNAPLPAPHAIPKEHRIVLDDTLMQIEKRSGTTFQDGASDQVSPILLTVDKVNVNWRPLAWYAMVFASNWVLRRWLVRSQDARFGSYNGLEYCIRIPKSWDAARGPRPIVFFHGLGLGLMQYKSVLSGLLRNFSDRPLLVPLQPNVSQDIFHPRFLKPMTKREMTACLSGLLKELGWVSSLEAGEDSSSSAKGLQKGGGVVMLSHSNGSFAHAWFLKAHPEMAVRSCFVDPITFCCWEGDMCYDFLYKRCSTGLDLVMRYFVGTELGVANTLQRYFDWTSNSLWFEEVPNARDPQKTLVVLGGKDAIVNAKRVKRYLSSHGVRQGMFYDPKGRHGQPFSARSPARAVITTWLKLA